MTASSTLVDLISRHAAVDGLHPTAIPGVSLARAAAPTVAMPVVYEPTLCLIAQGRKRVIAGGRSFVYDAASYLVASIDIPVMGSVIEASEREPYLCLVLDLDMTVLSDLALRHPAPADRSAVPAAGIELNDTSPELFEAAVRLARLLDTPQHIDELAPLAVREILYRLLTGSGHGVLRQLANADSRLRQIAKAIAWLRGHYAEGCRIEDMAEVAGMSRSTFHTHFKAVTSMSPLAFRSQLRLQEAQRLMVAQAVDAAAAGYRVGYESPSQFSRDYRRLFGVPPAEDARRLRQEAPVALS